MPVFDTITTPANRPPKPTKKPSQQAVLDFLKTYRDPQNGLCIPSNKEIAEAVGIKPGTVSRITAKLVKSGRIEKTAGWEFSVDGQRWIFTTDQYEAEANAQRADHSGYGGWARGPNLFKVVGVLLLFVLMWPTVSGARSISAYEALCYKSLLAVLFAHLLKIFLNSQRGSRLEAL